MGRNPLKTGQVIPTKRTIESREGIKVSRNPLKTGQVIPTHIPTLQIF